MVQPHFVISAALIAAVIALNCKNCNAGIARFDDIIDDIDASDRNGLDRAIKPKALKWLKKQVKKLNKAMGKKQFSQNEELFSTFIFFPKP